MKDIVTPVTPEEVKSVIRKCLENAALVNYTRISQNAKVEGKFPITIQLTEVSFSYLKINLLIYIVIITFKLFLFLCHFSNCKIHI